MTDRPRSTGRRRALLLGAALAGAIAASGCATLPEPPERHAVFFEPDSATLDTAGQDLMARLAREIRAKPAREVLLEAFANRAPDGTQNRALADQRAAAITRALVAGGVDARILRSTILGEAERIGPSALEGRRVDVTILR